MATSHDQTQMLDAVVSKLQLTSVSEFFVGGKLKCLVFKIS
ncbi:hypothetical protein EDD53_1003 [Pacificibacter maritimus]|uniref:Uncharacterized protein n=1 Tax=Pacificibacter maritimus TaxID=762213 RepID=A0A3N4UMP8_9RHOB|nr:hypothetical protein EDD53_1003 [Pacificibacter maritimus]